VREIKIETGANVAGEKREAQIDACKGNQNVDDTASTLCIPL
jgi:hypothetical protein